MTKDVVAKAWPYHAWADGTKRSWPEPEFPIWYPASAGVVVEIDSGTTIGNAARDAGANSYPGSDPDNLAAFWSGGALVYIAGQPYLVVMGGGHSDGAYNGILKYGPLFGAGSDTPSWSVFLAASATGAVQNASTYTDGRMSACHTYNNLVGVGDTLYAMATDAYYSSGNSSDDAFAFTPAGQAALAANIRAGQFGAAAYFDGKIYHYNGTSNERLRIYTIATDSWATEPGGLLGSVANYLSAAVDTTRSGLLVANGSTSMYWDLSDLTRTTGLAAPTNYDQSLEYDPDRDAFVSVIDGSLSVRELDAANVGGAWTTRTFTGDIPSAAAANGTFGRFRYVSELKGYVLAPSTEASVYFYRSA